MSSDYVNTQLKDDDYERKKLHYQKEEVAETYDEIRWSSPSRRRSNKRKLRAINRAISAAAALGSPILKALDIPCGTGRIFHLLSSRGILVTGADLSNEMMRVASGKSEGSPFIQGYIQCDAESMPFPDNYFDAIFSIRFLFHLPTEARRRALKEMARVSRQWVIVDYRHRYTIKYLLKRLQLWLGLSTKKYERLRLSDIREDFREAELKIVSIFPTFPLLSDKWVLLGRKISS